jgi:hypothetical protein
MEYRPKVWTECKTPNWDHRKQGASWRKKKTSWVSVAEPEWHTGRGWGTMGGRECGQRGLGAWAGPGPGPTCHQRSADASLHPPPWSQSSTLLYSTYSIGIVHIRKYCSINGADRWPNTTSAWAGWSRFDIPVDRYCMVWWSAFPANLHQQHTEISDLPLG